MNRVLLSLLLLGSIGCATVTGPSVSREEITQATEELKVKALQFRIKQWQRLYEIGDEDEQEETRNDSY